ncbi:MAG: pyruvate dehydrogenase [Gemmatimonadota bacterium]|nr:pyruvate dehydrogenase [Gemmatimonadota bacterium]
MPECTFGRAIDLAIEHAMARDATIVLIGEDVPMLRAPLVARFGTGRVLAAPISEAAFLGAAAGAAMGGLRPVVELYMVDFIGVGLDAVLNHMAKLDTFSGGGWRCPVLIRAPSGGGYGDGGQHGQSLWGMLAAIPGLTVVVPSTPADAYGLTATALGHDGPVVLFESKLLSAEWLEFLGRGARDSVTFDVPPAGARGAVEPGATVPLGQAAVRRQGGDLTIAAVAVGVHRALEAADRLAAKGIECEVIDLRSLRPLDRRTVVESVRRTSRLLVADEDYVAYGLAGELAAVALEAGLTPRYARVCLEDTLPYARHLEAAALPNVERIIAAALRLTD